MGASERADELAGLFPKLSAEGFEIVAPPLDRYNCIAFAAGDTGAWWSIHRPDHWPAHATRSNRIASLVEVFAGLGFEQCRDSRTEPGFEKVALYEQQGAWTHVAVQTPRGTWRSKRGEGPIIEHDNLEPPAGGPTATRRSACDVPVVPPAPSDLNFMRRNSPRTRNPLAYVARRQRCGICDVSPSRHPASGREASS